MTERLTKIVLMVLAFAVAGVTMYMAISFEEPHPPLLGPKYWLTPAGVFFLVPMMTPFWCCSLLGLANARLFVHALLIVANSFVIFLALEVNPQLVADFDTAFFHISFWIVLYVIALPTFAFPGIQFGRRKNFFHRTARIALV